MMAGLNAPAMVSDVLHGTCGDGAMSLFPGSKGWQTQQLARKISSKSWSEEPFSDMAISIVKPVADCMYKHQSESFSHVASLDALSSLIATTVDDNLLDKWMGVVKPCAPTFPDSIYDNLLQHIFDEIIPAVNRQFKLRKNKTSTNEILCEVEELSSDEKAILHYVIGALARKLVRKYSRRKSNKASQLFLNIVHRWAEPLQSSEGADAVLSDSVKSWTLAQDRGSLLYCSAHFFHFMKLVELKTRALLNTNTITSYAGKNIVPTVAGEIKSCSDVKDSFKTLIGSDILNESLCEALMDDVLTSWIAIRAPQAAKQYIYSRRSTGKTGTTCRMGTPALRKTLDKQ